mgnify:CR=1 FL=1
MSAAFNQYNPAPRKSREIFFEGFRRRWVSARESSTMKLKTLVPTTLVAFALAAAAPLFAQDHSKHGSAPKKAESATDAELIAKARANYPLKSCLVSDESLGSMGDAVGYIHRVAGKPDRVVFFCCEGCTDDFKASPAKFLAKVDAAAKAKAPTAKKS